MRYKNSPVYIQYQIDCILRLYQNYAQAYIDDIVIVSHILEDYLKYLRQIFTFLAQKNIFIKSNQAYIRYSLVHFLGQKVDLLSLKTIEEKL